MHTKARLAAASAMAALLAACLPSNLFGQLADLPAETPGALEAPSSTPPPVTGGFGGDLPISSPAPTATPTALATLAPGVARAVEVTINADGLPITEDGKPKTIISLNRLPRVGATPLFDTSRQFEASILLSNGLFSNRATWRSTRPDTAAVDANGLVTAGNATGSTDIVATSEDGQASASARVILTDDAAAEVVVD